jgi:hypothetical protein
MLEKIPSPIGRALRSARPGPRELVYNHPQLTAVTERIALGSSAFAHGERIPRRYTADGAKLSPPLRWSGVPLETASLVLLIEDADSPTPKPLVHALVWDLAPNDGELAEGALPSFGSDDVEGMGRNSFMQRAFLPPDPPPAHGLHRYAFQLFALDQLLHFERAPGRSKLLESLEGHAIAKGCLIGTYERT